MKNFIKWIIERISEKSTWYGIIATVSALGFAISPDLKESITVAGVAVAGLISTITKENNK
jgi:hypothetical protein